MSDVIIKINGDNQLSFILNLNPNVKNLSTKEKNMLVAFEKVRNLIGQEAEKVRSDEKTANEKLSFRDHNYWRVPFGINDDEGAKILEELK